MEIQTKEQTFKAICNVRILFETLGEEQQEKFYESLNKNPLRFVITSDSFMMENICDYDQYRDYFIYRKNKKSHKLHFISKSAIRQFSKNMKACVINDMKTVSNYKLN